MSNPTLLVSGAGGNLGRRVVELLKERGHGDQVIAGSRDVSKVADLSVETRRIDFDDPDLDSALKGVDHFLLISTDVLDDHRIVLHTNAVKAAASAGVKHITYTSMINPEPGSPITFSSDHFGTEQAIKESGVPYTILRVVWYAENLLGSLPQVLKSGQWFTATGGGRIGHAAREDAARAAAGSLLAGGTTGRVLDVTGPTALTTRDIAAVASKVTGKPIDVIDVTEEQLEEGLKQAGVPEHVISTYIIPFDRNTREGRIDAATDAVETLWGTKPQTLEDFLGANKAALLA